MIQEEHFVPIFGEDPITYAQKGDLAGAHHLIRYAWALEVIADFRESRVILDIACGAGYGSFALAQRFPKKQIVGADYDTKAIEYARQNYSAPNLEFREGDITRWEETIGSTIFDCIVSFDTLEHISHREIMMENLLAHLHPDGALLLSTPCGGRVNNLKPEWEAHKIEYSTSSLYDFLRRYFKTIQRPDNFTLPHIKVFDQFVARGGDYFLWLNPVVCKNPMYIENPYLNVSDKKVQRYLLISRARVVWRNEGLRVLLGKVYRRLKNR